jgi:16S rRNA (adenine1518-N6/adenine1519-N6)-dimethyltransferase
VKAKKSYGQHFLNNESTAERIASFLPDSTHQNVLEIGPGKGMLTKYLISKTKNFKTVEADRDMISYLAEHYPKLEVIELDFLKLALPKVFDGQPFTIIGNFPYNISSQIVFKMINHHELVPEMVGMFQKEMADRIIALPGSKTYGVISVLTQAFYKGYTLMKLAPGAFNPPPKVNSAVIRLSTEGVPPLVCDHKLFRRIVKATFNQRRKMLRNTLRGLVIDHAILEDDYFNNRPEQLSVKDFEILTNKLEKHIKHESRDENNE